MEVMMCKKSGVWEEVGSIPPILNFIPLPSHQEVYCKTAKECLISIFIARVKGLNG